MITAKLFTPAGEEKGTVELPDWAFGSPINRHVMWEVVRSYLANQRQGTVATKTRATVSGGGKKPWAQKKTGRARAGTTRSPVMVGGGRAHGPKPRDYRTEIPRKIRRLALRSALTLKARGERITVLTDLPVPQIKTREVYSVLKNLGTAKGKTLLVLPEHDEKILRASRNIPTLQTAAYANLNTYQVLRCDRLVLLESALNRMKEIDGQEAEVKS